MMLFILGIIVGFAINAVAGLIMAYRARTGAHGHVGYITCSVCHKTMPFVHMEKEDS